MINCDNCRKILNESDVNYFKAEAFKHGYSLKELENIDPCLCMNCSYTKEMHNSYMDNFQEY
jgi:hypothetical protein